MNCIKCGKELESEFVVCPYCGTAINPQYEKMNEHSPEVQGQFRQINPEQNLHNYDQRSIGYMDPRYAGGLQNQTQQNLMMSYQNQQMAFSGNQGIYNRPRGNKYIYLLERLNLFCIIPAVLLLISLFGHSFINAVHKNGYDDYFEFYETDDSGYSVSDISELCELGALLSNGGEKFIYTLGSKLQLFIIILMLLMAASIFIHIPAVPEIFCMLTAISIAGGLKGALDDYHTIGATAIIVIIAVITGFISSFTEPKVYQK